VACAGIRGSYGKKYIKSLQRLSVLVTMAQYGAQPQYGAPPVAAAVPAAAPGMDMNQMMMMQARSTMRCQFCAWYVLLQMTRFLACADDAKLECPKCCHDSQCDKIRACHQQCKQQHWRNGWRWWRIWGPANRKPRKPRGASCTRQCGSEGELLWLLFHYVLPPLWIPLHHLLPA